MTGTNQTGPDRVEPLSRQDVAGLVGAGVLDVVAHDPAVLVTAWRAIAPEHSSASGIPLVDGLTPGLGFMLITRYSRAGGPVVDLTSDLAIEGAAGAGGRRYVKADPCVASILADARHRGNWPPADLVVLGWPHHHGTQPERGTDLPSLLHDCRALLHPRGHLVCIVGLDGARITLRTRGRSSPPLFRSGCS